MTVFILFVIVLIISCLMLFAVTILYVKGDIDVIYEEAIKPNNATIPVEETDMAANATTKIFSY